MATQCWAIFHRGDNHWIVMPTQILKYINDLPLVQLDLPHPAVTSPDFLFESEETAQEAADKRNE